jgi:lysophospholipase L1-like esterase
MKKLMFLLAPILLLSSFKPREVTWIAIGDSITYLNDHLNETGNRLTKGYLSRVADHYPGMRYINKGYNGWTAAGIAQQIDSLGLTKADIYTVFLGTNDWWSSRPVGTLDDYKSNKGNSTYYGSMRVIINKIRSLNPDAKIVLIAPMQRADFVYLFDKKNNAYGSYKAKNGQYLESFANAINDIGKLENIPVVDLYHNSELPVEKMVKFKRLKDPTTGQYTNYPYPQSTTVPFDPTKDDYPYPKEAMWLTYDGLHPSDEGDAIIAKAIIKALGKVL